jgi:predicted PurR-regulated permease PerM
LPLHHWRGGCTVILVVAIKTPEEAGGNSRPTVSSASAVALWILAVIATVFFLRASRMLLIPIALAVLISYALAPLVSWLERWRVPRLAGAGLVLLLILGASVSGAYALRDEATDLASTLPRAMQRAREEVRARLGAETEIIEQATDALGATTRASEAEGGQGPEASGETSPLVQRVVGSMVSVAGHSIVIFFLVYFFLISGQQVRNRVIEVAGPERRRTASTIIDDINAQIQRYLLVLLVTATGVALATWAVLAALGMQHAVTWGILAGVVNSMPYFGPVVVSGGLFFVGMVQGGGVAQALQLSGASMLITSLEGWLVTPALMGKAERMSALAVFLGVLLWTWMWGAWGTVLAVPMLVIVKSVADHVAPLRPIGRLMAP